MAKAKCTTREECLSDGSRMNVVDCNGCEFIPACLIDYSVGKDLVPEDVKILMDSIGK